MRTPRAEGAGGRDRILAEAQNLQKLTNAQTPLFGGDNPELHASDFAGITPRNTVPTTPHPLAAAATPQVGGRFGSLLQQPKFPSSYMFFMLDLAETDIL